MDDPLFDSGLCDSVWLTGNPSFLHCCGILYDDGFVHVLLLIAINGSLMDRWYGTECSILVLGVPIKTWFQRAGHGFNGRNT